MDAFYTECAMKGVNDMEITSRGRLYGIISDTTAATGVDINWNYAISDEGYKVLHTFCYVSKQEATGGSENCRNISNTD